MGNTLHSPSVCEKVRVEEGCFYQMVLRVLRPVSTGTTILAGMMGKNELHIKSTVKTRQHRVKN